MGDMDELKGKIREIFQILGRMVRGKDAGKQAVPSGTPEHEEAPELESDTEVEAETGEPGEQEAQESASGHRMRKRRRRRHTKRRRAPADLILQTVLGCFILGFAAGFGLMRVTSWSGQEAQGLQGGTFSLGRLLLGKTFSFPGRQADGTFLFSNFEKNSDFEAWKKVNAVMLSSGDNPAEGARAAQITVRGAAEEFGGVLLDDLVRSRRGGFDWSRYGTFQAAVFNPGVEAISLTVLVVDSTGRSFKEDVPVPGKSGRRFAIPIAKIAAELNAAKVNQVSFYGRPKHDMIFYLDDIRLAGAGMAAPPVGTALPLPSVPQVVVPAGINPVDYGFQLRKPAWLLPNPESRVPIVRIPFAVRNETPALCWLCPVEGSVPLPMSEVKSLNNLRLRSAGEEDMPFQPRVLARWPDGSIKWVGLYFEATLPPGQGTGFFLDYSSEMQTMEFGGNLELTEESGMIWVKTGPLKVGLSKKEFTLFDTVYFDANQDLEFSPDERMVHRAVLELKGKGSVYRADRDTQGYTLAVEERGTKKAVIRGESWLVDEKGERYCKVIVHYTFYQGKNFVKVEHTLIYTGYPANKYYEEYKDIVLPPNETIDAFGVRLPYNFIPSGEERQVIGQFPEAPLVLNGASALNVFQKSWKETQVTSAGAAANPQAASAGWFDVSNMKEGLAVTVRDFRENFPKGFSVDPAAKTIELWLWPEAAGPLDLQTTEKALGPDDAARGSAFGLAKTHEILFHFHGGSPAEVQDRAVSFGKRLIARPNPYWLDATGALGRLFPVERQYAKPEQMLEGLFHWAAYWPLAEEWYGMLNFGDTLTWFRAEDDSGVYPQPGWHPVGRWGWYNCEGPGTHYGALLQFARSGQWKYFEFGENLARHIMDVDTIHYNTIASDPRLKSLSDDMSQPGSMHRHSGDHWSGRSDEASHTNVAGLLLYYYLSGDERVLEVSKEVGEFFLKEKFTYTGHPDMAPQRAMANALWGSVMLYDATGDDRYKKLADKLIGIFLKGQQPDGSFLENYNPKDGTWSGEKHEMYMSWYDVSAFIAYHQLTQDKPVADMLIKLMNYLTPKEYSGSAILHGIAYVYFLTHDPKWAEAADHYVEFLMKNQRRSTDPHLDGLVFEKPIYHRPNIFLSTVPYVFEAFEEDMQMRRSRRP
ncbi:MAG TPA: hypothetical protein VL688_10355 [Verrucomicrobiae bacterium]|nr:hypothetical protein [Verrucomicrobiae bacterium]